MSPLHVNSRQSTDSKLVLCMLQILRQPTSSWHFTQICTAQRAKFGTWGIFVNFHYQMTAATMIQLQRSMLFSRELPMSKAGNIYVKMAHFRHFQNQHITHQTFKLSTKLLEKVDRRDLELSLNYTPLVYPQSLATTCSPFQGTILGHFCLLLVLLQ